MKSHDKFDWKKHLIECMKSTEFCCIATVDQDVGAWSNPVYFAWNDDINLYFISQPQSRHMGNILKDGRISVSIYNTQQSTFDDVVGIQLTGKAWILTDAQEVKRAYAAYYGRKYPATGRNEAGKDEDAYVNNPVWVFVKIVPNDVYYFNTKIFDEKRRCVPEETFRK